MTTERAMELFFDERFNERVRSLCRCVTKDEDYQAEMFASAWAWISSSVEEDADAEAILSWLELWRRGIKGHWSREPYGPLHFRLEPVLPDVGLILGEGMILKDPLEAARQRLKAARGGGEGK